MYLYFNNLEKRESFVGMVQKVEPSSGQRRTFPSDYFHDNLELTGGYKCIQNQRKNQKRGQEW